MSLSYKLLNIKTMTNFVKSYCPGDLEAKINISNTFDLIS